ncbi:NAD-binding protein, partial [Francisella tularensis subsp. holarctica]
AKKHFIDAESHDYDALIKAHISKAKCIFILNEKDSDNFLTLLAIKEVLQKDTSNMNQPKISLKLSKEDSINLAHNMGV